MARKKSGIAKLWKFLTTPTRKHIARGARAYVRTGKRVHRKIGTYRLYRRLRRR
jgi:hypothetical protein